MNILDKIVAEKRREVAEARQHTPETALRSQAKRRADFREFKAALRKPEGIALIAEVKKASPSAGVICEDFDPVSIAKQYEQAGSSACSVLTDEKFFQGHLSFLSKIRGATKLPLLRKDFIIDEYQIYETSVAGADAILLIVAILDLARLKDCLAAAKRCRLAALVEIHDETEREVAIQAGAEIIGINNRNLKDFSVSLATTERLVKGLPRECVIVAESGIHTRTDVERLQAAGVDAILVGESLMRSGNIEAKVKELLGR
jgi:indole-3-glycerol phosphate synthase